MSASADLIRAVAALAWPVLVLAALLVFRAQLGTSLARGFRRVKAGPVELEWADQLAEVRIEAAAGESRPDTLSTAPPLSDVAGTELTEELRELVTSAPQAAIEEAYRRIETELRRILAATGASDEQLEGASAVKMARSAMHRGLLREETLNAVEGVATLRNLSLHDPAQGTPGRAAGYVITADAVLFAIRQNERTALRAG